MVQGGGIALRSSERNPQSRHTTCQRRKWPHSLWCISESRVLRSLLEVPAEVDLAYRCGNAYLFDYGDRHLATKGAEWRNGKPTNVQRDLFHRLRDKVKDISAGSVSFAEPAAKKGEYGTAIAALNAEMVLLDGRKIESEQAKQFIKENVHARIAGTETITVTSKGNHSRSGSQTSNCSFLEIRRRGFSRVSEKDPRGK